MTGEESTAVAVLSSLGGAVAPTPPAKSRKKRRATRMSDSVRREDSEAAAREDEVRRRLGLEYKFPSPPSALGGPFLPQEWDTPRRCSTGAGRAGAGGVPSATLLHAQNPPAAATGSRQEAARVWGWRSPLWPLRRRMEEASPETSRGYILKGRMPSLTPLVLCAGECPAIVAGAECVGGAGWRKLRRRDAAELR